MDKVVVVYKPQGVTPVQLIEQFRKKIPKYAAERIGFAGRLDPLAHGVMLLTLGEANKNREPLLNLSKTYKFKVLLGVETDTYDYLGVLKSAEPKEISGNFEQRIKEFISKNCGKITLPYPPFSSKTLNGVPLFKLAKRNKLKEKDLPLREVEIFEFNFLDINKFSAEEIKNVIADNLKKIKGYFRQNRIIKQWEDFFEINQNAEFLIAEFEIDCSSGTYVRTLAHRLGQDLDTGAIAFEILRTRVGNYTVSDCLKVF